MPVYQYRGIECGHEFDVRQSFSDDPLTECQVCGLAVRRVIHASPVVFKGSGWYVTDSRPTSDPVGGVKEAVKKDGDAAKPADAKPDTTESKPAAKSEPVAANTTKAE
jgi:putative FmdB family regulatory protein